MPKSKKINSLAFRQAKTVFLVSVILGICFSFYHILVDLHQEQKRIEEHYQFKLLQNYSNASQAAYHLNQLLAEQVASSLMMDNAVYKVQLVDDFGDTLTEKERSVSLQGDFIEALSSYLTPATPIYTTDLHQPNSHVVVGTLSFSVNGANIAKDFIAKTSRILLFDLFRNILLTSILLMFFYQKLSKPLITLIDWVRSLQNAKTDIPPPTQYRDDELGQLAKTFHTLWVERESATAQLNQLAYYDSLTGLANRSLLLQMLKDSISESSRTNQAGALFYLDLDRFKTINDSLGHTIGDNLIKAISKRIEAWLNEDFTAARIGGDEFALLLPNTSADKAHEFAQQLLALISNPYSIDDHQLYCTVSVGIAVFPSVGSTNIDVLRQADTALYRAKTAGRNKYMFYEPEMQAQVESFLEIEKGLHEALNKGQLELYYQPQVDDNHYIIGVEALIRWNHPQKGLLPPGVFMPIAEETGQILQIGNWIIEQACYQFSNWKKQGILPETFRRLAINISPLQFSQPSFVEHIVDSLAQAGIDGEHIELEITENLLLENVEAAIQKMAELKAHNLKTSIDDFGTGYSSLRYLKHLSVDVLKIDRSFVTQLHLDESDQAIVDTIIMTAQRLNLEVIAEGVEDVNELNALKQLGCVQFQGYLFDKPLPASELNERFEKNFYPVDSPSVVKAVQK
ncbi:MULTISPECIES: putative bifunctional diguanylate cyclase/phosphodiesterase [Vibrio]|uniref:C-di-GMP phosphodiesterase n=1 Tax=Vibrio bivalvicida TaxID=1276888 RepID=A0A177Y5X9_9VIBR|nr:MULTISPECIES: EAL domain-containing protein [Vibrio]KLN64207.1 c-di-GMP phosphodiesterase [Vibrio sp. VPAP30]OAJ96016.1 c-di-GMP phosphodiesterase [Vibrio bivalvicida]